MSLKTQVERYSLDKVLVKGTVDHIAPVIEETETNDWIKDGETYGEVMRVTKAKTDGVKKRVKYFQVRLQEGITLKARQVVMATGPTRAQMANIPSWVQSIGESYPEERLQHTVHLMHHLPIDRQNLGELDSRKQNDSFPAQGKSVSF